MARTPFVMKVSFKKPCKENNKKNVAHLNYIATRSGVELNSDKELFVDETNMSTNQTYVRYIDERPRSHGLFGDSEIDLKDISAELANHKGIVWRGILSLREDEAIRLGYMDQKSWRKALLATMPDAAHEMGIAPSNLRWCAAFHQEKGHPHVHFLIWEKKPIKSRGKLTSKELKSMKKIFIKEIYQQERNMLNQEKTAIRDYIRSLAKETISEQVKALREIKEISNQLSEDRIAEGYFNPTMPKKLYPDEEKVLIERLKELSEILPKKGRIAYKLMPSHVKAKVNEISAYILDMPQFREEMLKFNKIIEQMTRQYTTSKQEIDEAKENGYKDIQKRINQVILRGAKEANQEFREWNKSHTQYTNAFSNKYEAPSLVRSIWKEVCKNFEGEIRRKEIEAERQHQRELKQKLHQKRKRKEKEY